MRRKERKLNITKESGEEEIWTGKKGIRREKKR